MPGRAIRFSLGAKFTATVLLILAATMAANTYYSVRTSTRLQEQQLRERGHTLGRLISLISPQAILAFDDDAHGAVGVTGEAGLAERGG